MTQNELKIIDAIIKKNKEDFLVIGIGNRLKSDDGAGSIFAQELSKKFPDKFIDTGIAVENFIFKVAKKKERKIFVVDTMDFEGKAGDIKIFNLNDLSAQGISTHALSLKKTLKILEEFGKRVYVIGIKPRSLELSEEISEEVKNSIEKLREVFLNA